MMRSPLFDSDPQGSGPQYLEDLATAYWHSQVLFVAVEHRIFTRLEPQGKTIGELADALGFKVRGLDRFLNVLCEMRLLGRDGSFYFNTGISSDHLVEGKEHYQGGSILWRRELVPRWSELTDCLRAGERTVKRTGQEDTEELSRRRRKYLLAMDCVAKMKMQEMLPIFEGMRLGGEMLDAGAGSGAVAAGFLACFPFLRATLAEIPEVLEHTRGFVREMGMEERADLIPMNILDPWPFRVCRFDLVALSNLIHAYSEKELPGILSEAAACLKEEGLLVIHDFFFGHFPEKAALFDLNMFCNTYNGRVFSDRDVIVELERLGLHSTGLVPLGTDTGLIIASKKEDALSRLRIDKKMLLSARIKALGFRSVSAIPADTIHIPAWADIRCRYGCGNFGKPHCPPHSPSPEKTREVIRDYTHALLLEGEPPTGEFQLRVLRAEREAFNAGYYKALSFWAGPCSLCHTCAENGVCRNPEDARPSMEGAGIDVFETIRRAGLSLRTLNRKGDFARYFGMVLLE